MLIAAPVAVNAAVGHMYCLLYALFCLEQNWSNMLTLNSIFCYLDAMYDAVMCPADWGSSVSLLLQAPPSKSKIKFKPLIDEEDERRRASAAAKLRALDEAIASRLAEKERYTVYQ